MTVCASGKPEIAQIQSVYKNDFLNRRQFHKLQIHDKSLEVSGYLLTKSHMTQWVASLLQGPEINKMRSKQSKYRAPKQ